MAESSICLNRLATIEGQLRSKADAVTELARGFLAEREGGRCFGDRPPLWHAAIKTINIAIEFTEIERLQVSLLSLLRSRFCESLSHDEGFAAAARVDDTVQSLERLLKVSKSRRGLAYRFWKRRLDSLRANTDEMASRAQDLHRSADWWRAARRFRSGG